jgi:hypothetical protein
MPPIFIFFLFSFIWAPTWDGGYEKIDVIEVKYIENCAGYYRSILGCHYQYGDEHFILLQEGKAFQKAYLGYNLWTHEALHAYGISHAEMEQQYVNPELFPPKETDPRDVPWFVGEP